MADHPIPVPNANEMIENYISYMTSLGVDMNHQTQSVAFSSSTLVEWMNSIVAYTDEFRIFMGRYPEGHSQAGRTTVIIWPYKNGEPARLPTPETKGGGTQDDDGGQGHDINPFNDGAGSP